MSDKKEKNTPSAVDKLLDECKGTMASCIVAGMDEKGNVSCVAQCLTYRLCIGCLIVLYLS